ncbi:MAG: hypothetical protein LC102_08255 [Ignavibacteriales bacterium]|nr:hypothetical protein [Ignavibacteriaceae bacterium]MBW7872681.1 hypothetical protein [Ignavibacteria bacterium]MBZ0197782.1 hypothetical protein [Ignavibacteriaceae bacterium]MCZ2143402.1 hypothetical protein [Ignavibacteriales bacterium]WKZ72274.1 MAG: hypothetical protein QY308_11655 [Ignavibacteriaceae bacterium]
MPIMHSVKPAQKSRSMTEVVLVQKSRSKMIIEVNNPSTNDLQLQFM